MRRGRLDRAGSILEERVTRPQRSPTRITAGLGIIYNILSELEAAGLVQVYMKKKCRQLMLTDQGREFLACYRRCIELFPS